MVRYLVRCELKNSRARRVFLHRATRIPETLRSSHPMYNHAVGSFFSAQYHKHHIMTPIGVVTPAFSTQVSFSPPPFVRKQRTPSSQCGIASHRHKWEHERQSNDLEGSKTKRMRKSNTLPTSIFLPLDLDRCDEKPKVICLKSRSLSWEESSIMVPASWADVQ